MAPSGCGSAELHRPWAAPRPAPPGAHHHLEGPRVAGGPPGELVGGGGQVGTHDQHVAVGLRHHHGRVGGEVAQPLLGDQAQLVVAHEGVVLDQHVRAAAGVVGEAGQGQLLGAGVAPHRRPRLEHEHLEPGPGEVGRRDQGVVPRAHDHHLRALGQVVRDRGALHVRAPLRRPEWQWPQPIATTRTATVPLRAGRVDVTRRPRMGRLRRVQARFPRSRGCNWAASLDTCGAVHNTGDAAIDCGFTEEEAWSRFPEVVAED